MQVSLLAVLSLAACKERFVWRQKIAVTVETPSGEVSGSSVSEVSWQENMFKDGRRWTLAGRPVVDDQAGQNALRLQHIPQRVEQLVVGEMAAARIDDCARPKKKGAFNDRRRCCITLTFEDSHCEYMRLDGSHEQADTRPLSHQELVQLHCGTAQAGRC